MSQLRTDLDHPNSSDPSVAAPPGSPQRALLAFTAALSAGELEPAAQCFARDACLVTPDATAIRGRDSIRSFLAQLIDSAHRIEVELGPTVIAGDVAFTSDRLTTISEGAVGVPFEQRSASTAILRLLEGSWKLQILAPWGSPR